MTKRTLLTRNMQQGERIVLDLADGDDVNLNQGRVVITLLHRYGRMSRLAFEMEAAVRVIREAQEPVKP